MDLIQTLKDNGQDFEFYPTTQEIISKVRDHLKEQSFHPMNLLDIGAGNGKVLQALKDHCKTLYAIEKSEILQMELDPSICVIGTDFFQQSLISVPVEVVFTNPPYAQYVAWMEKVFRESCSIFIYAVLPQMWKENHTLLDLIDLRDYRYEVLGSFDFLQSEDRKARAKVDLLVFSPNKFERYDRYGREYAFQFEKDRPFDLAFDQQFADFIKQFAKDVTPEKDKEEFANQIDSSLVRGKDYASTLVDLYNNEMEDIKNNYAAICKLNAKLLKEFGIDPSKLKTGLKQRLEGLKAKYWNELFTRFDKLVSKLTSKARQKLLDKLNGNRFVDFTLDNVNAIALWAIKNSNLVIDEQLIEVYERMVEKANIENYKSNKKLLIDNNWGYLKEEASHYYLKMNTRLVLDRIGGAATSEAYSYNKRNGLVENAASFLEDLLVVCGNLGYRNENATKLPLNGHEFVSGQTATFYYKEEKTGKFETLLEVKAFQKGTLHIKLNNKVALALNVEFGRLKGWLSSPKDAVYELQDLEAGVYYKSNFQVLPSSNILQLNA